MRPNVIRRGRFTRAMYEHYNMGTRIRGYYYAFFERPRDDDRDGTVLRP